VFRWPLYQLNALKSSRTSPLASSRIWVVRRKGFRSFPTKRHLWLWCRGIVGPFILLSRVSKSSWDLGDDSESVSIKRGPGGHVDRAA